MAGKRVPNLKPFVPSPDDPFLAEHARVSAWIEAAAKEGSHTASELKNSESGRAILDADREQVARHVAALAIQAGYWERYLNSMREQAEAPGAKATIQSRLDRDGIWARREAAGHAISTLLRRKLPLNDQHLHAIAAWILESDYVHRETHALTQLVKAVETFLAEHHSMPAAVQASFDKIAKRAHGHWEAQTRKLGNRLTQLLCGSPSEGSSDSAKPSFGGIDPAPAGSPQILVQLKVRLGLLPVAPSVPVENVGVDHFPLRSDSVLVAEHQIISDLLPELCRDSTSYHDPAVDKVPTGKRLLKADPAVKARVLLALAERLVAAEDATTDLDDRDSWESRYMLPNVIAAIVAQQHLFQRDGIFDFLLFFSATSAVHWDWGTYFDDMSPILQNPSEGEKHVLHRLRCRVMTGTPINGSTGAQAEKLTRLIGDNPVFFLSPGEHWTDALNADMAKLSAERRNAWKQLLQHALSATSARPSSKWIKDARALIERVTPASFVKSVQPWFAMAAKGRSVRLLGRHFQDTRDINGTIEEESGSCLRGLVWMSAIVRDEALVRPLAQLASTSYQKVRGIGPRAVKVGNAAVYALSEIASAEAVAQIAMLKVRVKFGTAQKEIEKALNGTAAKLGLPPDEVEEMAVPAYGMEEVGRRVEPVGDLTAEITVGDGGVQLSWCKADGKRIKSPPKQIKDAHAEELNELKAAVKDIERMLPAQRDRLDQLFLQDRNWTYETWRQRYLDHPLVGTIARRLIWSISGKRGERSAVWVDGQLLDSAGKLIKLDPARDSVKLWHPIDHDQQQVLAWRRFLEERQVRQPFKQAHREVYLLTDAERRTATYSNRFAAHIIRQHQFNALCGIRGWKNKLRLMVDADFPPATRLLPNWNLRAEFWIEGVGDAYGVDTNDAGTFLRLSTDQVRFYRSGPLADQEIPLEQIPPLVFSEIMRDVDLFIGVASLGNDPTWADGGADGRFAAYWRTYSFGDLTETAQTRKAVIERIVPRLKIADRCNMDGRFLIVRGDLRTYKIHLGSGNILMDPNDQYLCIVPGRPGSGSGNGDSSVFLPFEGDQTLSVILSKAFLLADDRAIKDASITTQIRGGASR